MLQLPRLLFFRNKNIYTANEAEMRYQATPGKRKAPDGEKEEAILTVEIWPGPWTVDYPDPPLRARLTFPQSAAGRAEPFEWIAQTYRADPERWQTAPSILDCEPWAPPAAEKEEQKG